MQFLGIIALCIIAAVVYGIVHDLITARVCVEYFTIGHPPVLPTTNPTLLAVGWGVIATWWVGVLLGFPLACVARLGPWPKRSSASLVRPLAALMAVSAAAAFVAGVAGALLASADLVWLVEPLASEVPREKHVAFLADLWAHSASYFCGFVGGAAVMLRVWLSRRRAAKATLAPSSP
jgi:hypothetical protein